MDFPERNALHSDLETNLIQKLEFFDDGPIDKTLAWFFSSVTYYKIYLWKSCRTSSFSEQFLYQASRLAGHRTFWNCVMWGCIRKVMFKSCSAATESYQIDIFCNRVHFLPWTLNWDPFYWHRWTLIPLSINNHMPSKMWDEITYPFANFNCCPMEVGEWIISNITPHLIMDVIPYKCWD